MNLQMYLPSNKYLEACKNFSRRPCSKIVINDVEYTGMDVIKSHPFISHEACKMIGEFPSKICKIVLFNRNNDLEVLNQDIKVYRGLVLDDDTREYIPQGIFCPKADDIKTNSTAKTIEITMKDKSINFDKPYGGIDNITYPCTIGEFVEEIVSREGFILETPEFPFYDFMLQERPNFDLETTTERFLLASVGEIGGCNVQMSKLGGVRIEKPILTNKKIKKTDYKSLSSKEKQFGPINSVVIGNKGMNNDFVKKDEESIEENGLCEWKIYDNPFVDLNKQEMIDLVAEQIIGMKIIPFEINDVVDDYLFDLNDAITIEDKNGNLFETTILKINSNSRIFSKIGASVQTNSQTDYKLAGSSKNDIEQIKLDVDHVKNEMRVTAERVTEQSETLVQQSLTLDGIQSTVSSQTTTLTEMKENQENLEKKQAQTELDINGFKIQVETLAGTVTGMTYQFTTEALQIADLNSKINSKFDNTGVHVYNYNKLSAIFTDKGTGIDKLIVTGPAQIGYLRFVKADTGIIRKKKCTQVYVLDSLIEKLEDLESE